MAEIAYQINGGQYVLCRDGAPVGFAMDEVALAIDVDTGSVVKHGPVAAVEQYARVFREGMKAYPQLADSLVVVTGRFPLEELNRCFQVTGHAGRLLESLKTGQLKPQPDA